MTQAEDDSQEAEVPISQLAWVPVCIRVHPPAAACVCYTWLNESV